MFKRLWQIFGPVLVAGLCLTALLLSPLRLGRPSEKTLSTAATSLSANVLKGEAIKDAAFNDNYIPMIGSSELSRMDALHPSVMANKYDWQKKPFLLGAPGTQSLTHFLSLQATGNHLNGKKAVVVISPQWFVPQGVKPEMFDFFYSPLQTSYFLIHAKDSESTRYAAKRILELTSDTTNGVMRDALKNKALGIPLTETQKVYINNVKRPALQHQDQLFSQLFIRGRERELRKGLKVLPKQPDNMQLDQVATELGQKVTGDNPFGIQNSFYKKRVKPNVGKLKGEQSHFNYESSPEFADFQLMLDYFAAHKVSVQFIIPPVNARWAAYTGLSQAMLNRFDKKIQYQLRTQGFNNIVDMTNDGNEQFFMQDTIHLGWRGWLKVDQKLQPFMRTKKAKAVHYDMSNDFLSRDWQNVSGNNVHDFD